jgi:hypothetical protein
MHITMAVSAGCLPTMWIGTRRRIAASNRESFQMEATSLASRTSNVHRGPSCSGALFRHAPQICCGDRLELDLHLSLRRRGGGVRCLP